MVFPSSVLRRVANGNRGTIALVTAGFSTDTFGADAGLESWEEVVCFGDSAVTETKLDAATKRQQFLSAGLRFHSRFSFMVPGYTVLFREPWQFLSAHREDICLRPWDAGSILAGAIQRL
jgi:hypothetical protein